MDNEHFEMRPWRESLKNTTPEKRGFMRILLIASAYNGLCQRTHVELEGRGHQVSITLALGDEVVRQAVHAFEPELIICPFLKEKLPEDIWRNHLCIIIHPGIQGDRGPASLDWAIMNQESEWGVTALAAAEEMDAGDIWSTVTFPMRQASKASLYRREVTQAAIQATLTTVEHFASRKFRPEALDYSNPKVRGQLRPSMKQKDRAIDWAKDTRTAIVRKINSADSSPGILDRINGEEFYLFGAHAEAQLKGPIPGAIIAQRSGAICRATIDGAVWITHLKRKAGDKASATVFELPRRPATDCKLPAAMLLGATLRDVAESTIELMRVEADETYREIWYEEHNAVGYLHFDFYNGAMSTEQCRRLRDAYQQARDRSPRVIVLMGGTDFWSNGIHLNVIDASSDPSRESWNNINAIDDVVRDIIMTDSELTVAAIWGTAGAGGVMMPLAADQVWAREGVILNPHYKTMGLFGSEYWTYLLPKRVGASRALELTETPLPVGATKAKQIGLIDQVLPDDFATFQAEVRRRAEQLAYSVDYDRMIEEKRQVRARDEVAKPLAAYRATELQRMRLDFTGKSSYDEVKYHEARANFVNKVKAKETAPYLAKHLHLHAAQPRARRATRG
jgi:putative two-component system protein, hydrogenase maturation factor HypX/HoxX